MSTMNLARFTINSSPSESATGDRGYDGAAGVPLVLALENAAFTASIGVNAVTFSIYDADDPTSPLASGDAPLLTFAGSGGASSVTVLPSASATLTIPASFEVAASYIIRATALTPTGAHVFERLVAFRNSNSLRRLVPSETTQYSQRGWSDVIDDLVDGGGGGGGANVGFVPVSSTESGAGEVIAVFLHTGTASELALTACLWGAGTAVELLLTRLDTGAVIAGSTITSAATVPTVSSVTLGAAAFPTAETLIAACLRVTGTPGVSVRAFCGFVKLETP